MGSNSVTPKGIEIIWFVEVSEYDRRHPRNLWYQHTPGTCVKIFGFQKFIMTFWGGANLLRDSVKEFE